MGQNLPIYGYGRRVVFILGGLMCGGKGGGAELFNLGKRAASIIF